MFLRFAVHELGKQSRKLKRFLAWDQAHWYLLTISSSTPEPSCLQLSESYCCAWNSKAWLWRPLFEPLPRIRHRRHLFSLAHWVWGTCWNYAFQPYGLESKQFVNAPCSHNQWRPSLSRRHTNELRPFDSRQQRRGWIQLFLPWCSWLDQNQSSC